MASRDKQLLVRATADELKRWQDAADAAGVSRSAWVRAALDDGAERGLVGMNEERLVMAILDDEP